MSCVVTVATPATGSTPSSWRSSVRYATPRDPDRDSRGPRIEAQIVRLRRGSAYPWQIAVGDVAAELNDRGDGYRYPIVVLSVPRRAGKSVLALAVALDAMDRQTDARCWYTAQRREDAAKAFRNEWAPMVTRTAGLRRLYQLRRSQGSEGVHRRPPSAAAVELFPPTETALHGQNADTVTVDEAWTFDTDAGEALEAAIRPAQLTRPWRQLWIVSAGGTIASTWWDRWITAGEAATPGVALFDFGADADAADYDPGSPSTWTSGHPSLGYGFGVDSLAAEWHSRSDDAGFERAYLNVWPRPSLVTVASGVELGDWSAAARPELEPTVRAIAVDVAADRSAAALAVAGPAGDLIVVQVADHRPGVRWLADAVRDARRRWPAAALVADSIVAASVVADLARVGVTVDPVGAGDHARACSTFVDLLAEGALAHRSQRVLDDAVAGAARRPLGDAWLWSRARSNVDISPLVAVTLAAWAAHARPTIGKPALAVASGAPDGNGRTRHTTRPRFAAPGRT